MTFIRSLNVSQSVVDALACDNIHTVEEWAAAQVAEGYEMDVPAEDQVAFIRAVWTQAIGRPLSESA